MKTICILFLTLLIAPCIAAPASVALNGLTQTYDGTPRMVTATTNPVGLRVDITYDGSLQVPINAGNYAIVAIINDPNYQGSAIGELAVSKATATVALNGLTQTYDGTPLMVTATTDPVGLRVDITYNGGSLAPINVWDYQIIATINDTNYMGSKSDTLHIVKADQNITVTTPAPASAVYKSSFTVEAFADSGLPIEYSASGSCSNVGPVFTMTSGTGTGTVHYNQNGNPNWNAAPEVTSNTAAQRATVTLVVPTGYATIQAAIDAASPGDTILVQSGTYYENVDVNKQLTLQGEGLPVVDAGGSAFAIRLSADGCTLQGFVARNTAIPNNGVGIMVSSSSNTVSGNTAIDNVFGIGLSRSGNTISGNTATGNKYGIFLSGSNNIVSGNTITSNYIGIDFSGSGDHIISYNTVTGNNIGIQSLIPVIGGTIYLNTFDNIYNTGIMAGPGNHWNATIPQTYDHNGRTLTGLLGNVWSDYSGLDCDGDGIGDAPYNIGGSEKDYHPIGGKQPGLEVEKLADRSEAEVGDLINYTIRLNNTGNVSLTGVRAEDDMTGAVWTVGTLAPGQNYTNTTRYQVLSTDLPGPLANELKASGTCSCGQVNASTIETVALRYNPQIQVNKTANLSSGAPSTILGFKIEVSNCGNANFTSVEVEDLLPQGLDYVSDDSGIAPSQVESSYTWNLGRLNSNESTSFNLTAHINGKEFGELVNVVNATGQPEYGDPVSSIASAAIRADKAEVAVTKTVSPSFGSPGANVTFILQVTNTGSASLPHVFVSDLLPNGLSYLSSDSGTRSGQYINWSNIGPLAAGASKSLQLVAQIDGKALGTLANRVEVVGEPEEGGNVSANATAAVLAEEANITVTKSADPASGIAGTQINFTLKVTNSGKSPLPHLLVSDLLPSGLAYASSSPGSIINGKHVDWPDAGPLAPGEDGNLWINARIDGTVYGRLTNQVNVSAYPEHGDPISSTATAEVEASQGLILTKTADKDTAKRGEDVTYNITLTNPNDGFCFTNTTLWDVLPNKVQVVSVSPAPSSGEGSSTLYWDIGTFCGGEIKIQIVVRIPIVDINYDMAQGVSGEGFVNVHNDYDTHQGPEAITNCAFAKADYQETLKSCASTKIVDPGTELKRREFGSGSYASEELLKMRTENKSIQSVTNLSATHKPTSFSLPGNRSIDYTTKWTEKSKGINTITGATMTEEYTFAQKIDKDRSIDLDKNGSTMKTDVSFTGTGHIGVLKKTEPDSHPKVASTFEGVEDYTGSFQVYEMVDEYGSAVRSEKDVTGYGYVAVDKRVGSSQRTYESGTGSYQSQEQIETPSNYIAKEIRLVHGPTNYSYSPGFATNQNIKWSEGMWSRSGYLAGGVILADNSSCPSSAAAGSGPASYISERYSSLDYLNKDTVASSLNQMDTNASFSGSADYQVKAIYANKSGEIDNEERYVGDYDITRKVQLTGTSRYSRPHITVTKEGILTKRFLNHTMSNVAEYVITIVNDGNVNLAPVKIRDIFPPGTQYIHSSIRPESLSETDVNWSLMSLGIGGSIKIDLELNVSEYAPANVIGNLVNRVMVCGMNGDQGCIAGSAYFVIESGELPCCPPQVALDKVARIDAIDPTLIHYTITVRNSANSTVAATLTDMLPAGLIYVSASNQPDRQEGQFLEWIVPDLKAGNATSIEYLVKASRDGTYVNTVHMDASSVDGADYDIEDASARIEIGSTGVAPRTTRYGGWQPPNWNMTTPEQGMTVELSPEEDLAG